MKETPIAHTAPSTTRRSTRSGIEMKTNRVRRLPESFTKKRLQYEQLCRTNDIALYVVHLNGRQRSYEVIVVRIAERVPVKVADGKLDWSACDPYECYPSSDVWGSCGFTFTTEADARAKFNLLCDPRFQRPAPPLYPIRVRARNGNAAEHVSSRGGVDAADAVSKTDCIAAVCRAAETRDRAPAKRS